MVNKHIADNPQLAFTPGELAKKLGHSSGAISNALDKLCSLGEAEQVSEKPCTFRTAHTDTDSSARAD